MLHSLFEGGIVAVFAVLASMSAGSRRFRSIAATLGLMSASAILVHFSGGVIEAHFHFFVMVSLITLYQHWTPFLLSIAYVIFHHGVMGTVDPLSVYNHPAAIASPFKWALIHGFFILAASVAGLIVWRRNEDLRLREAERLKAAAEARRQQVLEWNDSVVQGLAVAKMAAELGEQDHSSRAVVAALEQAQQIVSSLLDDVIEAGLLVPGALVLERNGDERGNGRSAGETSARLSVKPGGDPRPSA